VTQHGLPWQKATQHTDNYKKHPITLVGHVTREAQKIENQPTTPDNFVTVTHWNNRVLHDGNTYWIAEVYYDDTDTPISYTTGDPIGDWQNYAELANTTNHVAKALTQPILKVNTESWETFIGEMTAQEAMEHDLHKPDIAPIIDTVTSTQETELS
jgi:hypothetical protein